MNNDKQLNSNIVLIMSDQHNAHLMGCSGNEIVQTPNLDTLARTGVQFTNAYCPYPLCVPSRMSFMTGQYSSDLNIWCNDSVLSSEIPTFAHSLSEAGYETLLCGRMDFKGPDQFHGFEKRLYGDCDNFLSSEIMGEGYNRTNGQTKYAVEISGYGRTGYQSYDRIVTEKACSFIENRLDENRPYCLVVGFMSPHNPLICSKDLFEYYMNRLSVPEKVSRKHLNNLNPAIRKWRQRRGVDDLTAEQNHRGLAAYYGLVTEMDRNAGKIMESVKASRQAGSTTIIYCSDHGDAACEQEGMWWKTNFFEGSARIPLIITPPSCSGHGKTIDSIVSLLDLGPTMLEIAGAEPLPEVSGRSFAGFLGYGKAPDNWPNEVYSDCLGGHGDQPSCMVRSNAWKLMYYSEFDTCLLFNLEEDPMELYDKANDPEYHEIVEKLLARIKARWSAEKMLQGRALEVRDRDLLDHCGHATNSYPVVQELPPEDANQFDFSQLSLNGKSTTLEGEKNDE